MKLGNAVFALAFLATGSVLAADLSGKEISAVISGKSGTWHTQNGKVSGKVRWSANGIQTVTGNFGSFSKDTAKWWVAGDKFCNKFKKLRGGKEKCDAVKPLGGGSYQMGNSIFELN
jgi:hypothetical protein